jgi:hypothetical protein
MRGLVSVNTRYESGGQEFESLRARHRINDLEQVPPD